MLANGICWMSNLTWWMKPSVVPEGSDPFTRSSRLAKPFPASAEPHRLPECAGSICNIIMMKHFLKACVRTHTYRVQWLLIFGTSWTLSGVFTFLKNKPELSCLTTYCVWFWISVGMYVNLYLQIYMYFFFTNMRWYSTYYSKTWPFLVSDPTLSLSVHFLTLLNS